MQTKKIEKIRKKKNNEHVNKPSVMTPKKNWNKKVERDQNKPKKNEQRKGN
jgi:hypothetical protein